MRKILLLLTLLVGCGGSSARQMVAIPPSAILPPIQLTVYVTSDNSGHMVSGAIVMIDHEVGLTDADGKVTLTIPRANDVVIQLRKLGWASSSHWMLVPQTGEVHVRMYQ